MTPLRRRDLGRPTTVWGRPRSSFTRDLLVQRAGPETLGVEVRLGGVAADRRLDPVDRREPLVGQRAEDRVLDEGGTALSDGRPQPVVGLGDLGVQQLEVALHLGRRLGRYGDA